MQVKWPLYVYFLLICLIFVLVLTHQIGIKNLKKRNLNFKGVQNQPDASQKHDRGQSFSTLKLCQNIKTAKGVAWSKLKSTHRMNLAKLVPLPDKIDPSQD